MDSREVIADKIAEICDIITFKTNTTDSEKRMLVGEMMVLAGMIGQDVLSLADEYYRGINTERLSDDVTEFKKFMDFNKVKKKNKYDN